MTSTIASNDDRRVLIAEDDPLTRMWLQTVLESWQYQVVSVANGDEALHVLSGDDAPRLALLDWLMPGVDGTDVCRRLRADPRGRFTYLIILTSRSGTADIVEALDAGADDFVSKPFEPDELRVRLRVGERVVRLQRELHLRASHDELTGALSRRTLMENAMREFELARRNDMPLSLLLLDLDHFKRINDQHGHQVGDAVLQQAAARMRDCLRTVDLLGRYGGEEFMIVLPNSDLAAARQVAERLRAALAQPLSIGSVSVALSVSIGVAQETGHTLDLQHLIQLADAALLRAKTGGRNRVEVGG
jgi:diguanylate cyclase (GGDEF)-like protein